MIYAELAGGLGNQMFIYAFARALGLRCGEPVTLLDRQDWRDGAPAHTVCALDALNLAPEVNILAQPGFAKQHLKRQNTAKALMIKYEQRQGLMARDWNGWERRCAPLLNRLGVHFATDGYTPVHRGTARDFLAWGYFQSEAYFADFAPTIRQELRAKQPPAGEWADKIRAAAWPVALHLRRGDYCKPENEILQVCTPAYYARAAAAVAAAHPDAPPLEMDVRGERQAQYGGEARQGNCPRGTPAGTFAAGMEAGCRGLHLHGISLHAGFPGLPHGQGGSLPDRRDGFLRHQ